MKRNSIIITSMFVLILVFHYSKPYILGNSISSPTKSISANLSYSSYHHEFCVNESCFDDFTNLAKGHKIKCGWYNIDQTMLNLIEEKIKSADILVNKNKKTPKTKEGFHITQINYSAGLFHTKFCFWNDTLIVFSYNPTLKNSIFDVNDMYIIKSNETKRDMESIFKELKKGKRPKFRLNFDKGNIIITNYGIQKLIIERIRNSEFTYFLTYIFTNKKIADSLSYYKGYYYLPNPYDVFNDINGTRFHHPISMLHMKVFITNSSVISGSYNPTKSAEEHNEEISIIVRNSSLVKTYISFFGRIQKEQKVYSTIFHFLKDKNQTKIQNIEKEIESIEKHNSKMQLERNGTKYVIIHIKRIKGNQSFFAVVGLNGKTYLVKRYSINLKIRRHDCIFLFSGYQIEDHLCWNNSLKNYFTDN